MKLIIKMN